MHAPLSLVTRRIAMLSSLHNTGTVRNTSAGNKTFSGYDYHTNSNFIDGDLEENCLPGEVVDQLGGSS